MQSKFIKTVLGPVKQWCLGLLPPLLAKRLRSTKPLPLLIKRIGLYGALTYLTIDIRNPLKLVSIKPTKSQSKLFLRPSSSDSEVLWQIFVELEYDSLRIDGKVGLVVDCGANVGYSTAYFLTRYPESFVIAIEPDKNNFTMLQYNLYAYSDRVRLLRAGVWARNIPLIISCDTYRDGREWAQQVEPCSLEDDQSFPGLSVDSILAESGFDRITLLKVDVEGAEVEIFRDSTRWLSKVDNIVIELHDDTSFGNASSIFYAAIKDQGFAVHNYGELTFCHRISPCP